MPVTTHRLSRPLGRLAGTAGRWLAVAAVVATGLASLVGSGGGGGGSTPATLTVVGTSPTNGATNVAIGSAVSATFSENLTANPTFTLSGGSGAVAGAVTRSGSTATFTPSAPLAYATAYTASVSGGSGASGGMQSGTSTWTFTTAADPNAPPGSATISGIVDFESVPNDTTTNGRLLYASTTNRPLRGATVQVIAAAGGAVLASGSTSATGTYSLTITALQSVIVRVRAELLKTSGAGGSWNFTVRDNTQGDSLYVLDSAAFTPAAGVNTRNLRALSGWGGSSYTGARVAGPFAILDVVHDAKEKVLTASANAVFPALQLMWSVNNRPTGGNLATGLIGTSFYRFDGLQHRIYILGLADTDTDEYDRPVVAHEFGHYFQSAFSRDDSIGGSHGGADKLDMRVAFSEGWGNAWSGMALATQYYTDSAGSGQQSGFRLDLAMSPGIGERGWFSEASVQHLLYQWHANAGIGFTPIFNVLAAFAQTLPADGAVSSMHSFAHRLKLAVPAQAASIDTLLAGQSITVADAIGSTEANNGGIALALPVYKQHTAGIGVAQQHCVTDAAGSAGDERNKLAARVFIRMTLAAAAARTINAVAVSVGSDPDFLVIRPNGAESVFQGTGSSEAAALGAVGAGTHLIVLHDFELTDGNNSGAVNGERCFNVTVN